MTDSEAPVLLSALIKTNPQEGVDIPKHPLVRNNLCKMKTTEEVLWRHNSAVIPAGTSRDTNSTLSLCVISGKSWVLPGGKQR